MTLTNRDGKLWITFYHQSKRYRKSLGLDDTKANRKLALNTIIPEIQYKLNSGEFFNNENEKKVPTVAEFAKVSFEIHKNERRELTQKDYAQKYFLHIDPFFGTITLDKIKPSDLAKWQNKLLEKRSSKTTRSIRTVFQTIFEDAVFDDLITQNPFLKVKAPKKDETREKKPFSVDEIFAIIQEIPQHMKAFFAIGFFTGMRTGEIIGLKWSDINFDEKTIEVRRSRREGTETLPKTKNSLRTIEIIDVLMPYLIRHHELTSSKNEYLFETAFGKPFNTCAKIGVWYWKPTLEKLNIPYRVLYQMRHTFASMMISNGEDILWVSKMLGHKDSSMTLEVYARYVKQNNKTRASFLLSA